MASKLKIQFENLIIMKYFLLIFSVCIGLTGCSSVKQSTNSLNNGNYDGAITTSLDKLRRSPSKNKRETHIVLLEEAFAKAVQRDTDRINFLKKDGTSNGIEEIYNLYTKLNNRQNRIKPLLPLTLDRQQREAKFVMSNYDDQLIGYKSQLIDQLYSQAIADLTAASTKLDYRTIHANLERLNNLSLGYKNVTELLEEVHFKGTDFIEVTLYNDSNIALPKQLEEDLLDFTTYGLNDFWKVYHSTKQQDITYDYVMDVSLREINISPERVQERQLIKEKSIKDGTEYLTDKEGVYKLDEDGNKIEVDRFIDVTCNYYEVLQSKAVNIVGQVRYNNTGNGQLVKSFPLASEYVFEHYYATYDGDRRALDDVLLGYTRNRVVPFPTNEQMIYDVGEDLKQRLKTIIVNSNL
jgi:hypothetical protein